MANPIMVGKVTGKKYYAGDIVDPRDLGNQPKVDYSNVIWGQDGPTPRPAGQPLPSQYNKYTQPTYNQPTQRRQEQGQPAQRQPTQRQSFGLDDVASIVSSIVSGMQSNYRAPDIPRLSRDEMLTQAQNLANLQIDPIIQTLMRGKEDYLGSYESSKRNIEAAYAGIPQERDRLLKQAQDLGTESAIARGGGRSGAVEHGVGKLQESVMAKSMQVDAEKAAKLASLEEGLDLFMKQYGDKVAELEGRRGQLTTAIFDQLNNSDQQLALELAKMAENRYGVDMKTTLSLLPYFMNTKLEDDKLVLDWTKTMGQVPQYGPGEKVSMGDLNQIVGLRQYAENAGIDVGWDPATGNVFIGSQSYTPAQLKGMGAQLVNDRWQIPQSKIDELLYGRR